MRSGIQTGSPIADGMVIVTGTPVNPSRSVMMALVDAGSTDFLPLHDNVMGGISQARYVINKEIKSGPFTLRYG